MNFVNWFLGLFDENRRIKQQLMKGSPKKVELEGITYYIKRLSTQYVFDLQTMQKAKGKKLSEADMKATLFELTANAICDRKGRPVFTKDEVQNLNIFVLNSLITEAMDYNGLNPNAVARSKEALKNLKIQSESTIN